MLPVSEKSMHTQIRLAFEKVRPAATESGTCKLTQRCFLRRHLRGLSSLFLQDLELHALSSRRQNLEWRNEEDKWKNGQKSQRATATHLKAELNCTLSRPSQTYERTVIKSRLDEIKDHDTQRLQSQGRSKAACTHMQR